MNKENNSELKVKMRRAFGVARINFTAGVTPAYITLAIFAGAMLIMSIAASIIASIRGSEWINGFAAVNGLMAFMLIYPFFLVCGNFKKLLNLGAKKKDFFWGCLINYGIIAFAAAVINIISRYTLEKALNISNTELSLVNLFGWYGSGAGGAFMSIFYQAGAYFFVMSAIHLLLSMHSKNWAWFVDAGLILLLAVFLTVAPLREVFVAVFKFILVNKYALVQFAVAGALGAALYSASLFFISRKRF